MSFNVLVAGTGIIGGPVRGLLEKLKKSLDINVAFHKNTPQLETVGAVLRAMRRGSLLVTEKEAVAKFREYGIVPSMVRNEALENWADAVVDCTPAANAHLTGRSVDKKGRETVCDPWYPESVQKRLRCLIAQGSEEGFGVPYALGINDEAIVGQKRRQIVSCNTHNLLVVYRTIQELCGAGNVGRGRFVLIRRCSDISQQEMIASPQVDPHKLGRFGTHHAYDAHRVMATLGQDPNIVSSSLQIPSQYMHVLQFNIEVAVPPARQAVMDAFVARSRVAVTHRLNAAQIFSAARDEGFNGRHLDQTVVALKTIQVLDNEIVGFCFTPQDGNSLASTLAATIQSLYPDDWMSRLSILDKYHFEEV